MDLDAFFVVLIYTPVYNYFYMMSDIFLPLLISSSKTSVALSTDVVTRGTGHANMSARSSVYSFDSSHIRP